ncbi:MAG: discoidin domain-containing protein, partial [Clostridia bacterium]|nr:discoidin domain-containing protein [Clostridia bacterium]
TAHASSNNRGDHTVGAREVRFLCDGSEGNFIVTHEEDPDPWFSVDLGALFDINQVVLAWGATDAPYQNDYATTYRIQVSDDGEEWKTMYTVTDGTLETRTLRFDSVNTRFVRVAVDACADRRASLKELYVYETDFDNPYEEPIDPLKVLFIGNSHTYTNDLPGIVRDLMVASGRTIQYREITAGGQSLEWHAGQAATLQAIRTGGYDYVVLQEKASGFDADTFARGYAALHAVIAETEATPLLYMVWSNESKPQVQKTITEAYLKAAREQNTALAAAGVAWDILRHRDPPIPLYSDGNHATPLGSYLAACSIFYALTGETTQTVVAAGDTLATRLGLSVTDANLMQETAFAVAQRGYDVEDLLWESDEPLVLVDYSSGALVGHEGVTSLEFADRWAFFNLTDALKLPEGVYDIDATFYYASTGTPWWQIQLSRADGTRYTEGGKYTDNDGFQQRADWMTNSSGQWTSGTVSFTGAKLGGNDGWKSSVSSVAFDFGFHICGDNNTPNLYIRAIEFVVTDAEGQTHTLTWGIPPAQEEPPAPEALPGDVDGDEAITSTDARLTLQYYAGKIGAEDLDLAVADVDGDGAITSTDARLILQYYAGKIEDFPI